MSGKLTSSKHFNQKNINRKKKHFEVVETGEEFGWKVIIGWNGDLLFGDEGLMKNLNLEFAVNGNFCGKERLLVKITYFCSRWKQLGRYIVTKLR